MRGFSKAIITGNITRDPELRSTPGGTSVCGFTVAVNRVFRDSSGEQREDVSFIDCTAWGKLGEMISQYARKGTGVLVSGRLSQRSYEDKNGAKRSRVEIVVEDFNFTGGPNSGERNNGGDGRPSFGAAQEATQDFGQESAQDFAPEDMPEEPVDLSEVPF